MYLFLAVSHIYFFRILPIKTYHSKYNTRCISNSDVLSNRVNPIRPQISSVNSPIFTRTPRKPCQYHTMSVCSQVSRAMRHTKSTESTITKSPLSSPIPYTITPTSDLRPPHPLPHLPCLASAGSFSRRSCLVTRKNSPT